MQAWYAKKIHSEVIMYILCFSGTLWIVFLPFWKQIPFYNKRRHVIISVESRIVC